MTKIAFTGTSGSGKTTLVKYVAEQFRLNHISGSSGDLKNEHDRVYLEKEFGFTGNQGHAHVIRESHNNPELGLAIQNIILSRRTELIENTEDFVTDRSPLDNWVYFMLQAGLYQDMQTCQFFLEKAYSAFSKLTHVFYVPAMLTEVENNGSRIANFHYQSAVDAIFNRYWPAFQHHARVANPRIATHKIVDLDLATRKEFIHKVLSEKR